MPKRDGNNAGNADDEALKAHNESFAAASELELEQLKATIKSKLDAEYASYISKVTTRVKGVSIFAATVGIAAALVQPKVASGNIVLLISENWNYIAAAVAVWGGAVYLVLTVRRTKEVEFRDVDLRRRVEASRALPTEDALAAAVTLKTIALATGPVGDNSAAIETRDEQPKRIDHFQAYYRETVKLIEARAADAEEKASILLDKGTAYSRWGIVFFIATIVAWQIIGWANGFKTEHVYGMISCSAIFIFIEFLSGWFLRQYRHYVDTATYLLKMKSISDRHLLMYLTHYQMPIGNPARTKAGEALVRMLERNIVWPESYLLKRQAENFAGEASGSIKNLLKTALKKRKQKEKQKKEKSSE